MSFRSKQGERERPRRRSAGGSRRPREQRAAPHERRKAKPRPGRRRKWSGGRDAGGPAPVPRAPRAEAAGRAPVTSCDAAVVAPVRRGVSKTSGSFLRHFSLRAGGCDCAWAAVGAEKHEPRGRRLLRGAAADGRLAAPGGPPVRVGDKRHCHPGSRLGRRRGRS